MIDLAETRELTLDSSASSAAAAEILADWLAKRGKPRKASATGVEYIGSRFAYRMWGGTRRGLRKLPIQMTWKITDNDSGATVSIQMRSNEGTYLYRTYQHHLIYQRTFDQLRDQLGTLFR